MKYHNPTRTLFLLFTLLLFSIPIFASSQASATATTNEPDNPTQIYLPLVANIGQTAQYPNQVHSSHDFTDQIPLPPPIANSYTFVTSSGGDLDQYLGRSNLANGTLSFQIGIDAPIINSDWTNPDGSLNFNGMFEAVEQKVLPKYAFLTLQVFDIDNYDAGGDTPPCPEIDYVYINGMQIDDFQSEKTATLAGAPLAWSTWSVAIPIGVLRFPTSAAVVQNEITVEINALNCEFFDHKMAVDWGAIRLAPNLNYPIVFVHGWTGTSDGWKPFKQFAEDDGIQVYVADHLEDGVDPIDLTAEYVEREIYTALQQFKGIDKVTIFAHSKGGLAIRRALRNNPQLARHIANVVTFGSPHHGADAIMVAALDSCKRFLQADPIQWAQYGKCWLAASEQTKPRIATEFNYYPPADLPVCKLDPFNEVCNDESLWLPRWEEEAQWRSILSYYSIVGGVGDVTVSATYPWNADHRPFPNSANVDAVFQFEDHVSIKESRGPYDEAMRLLGGSYYSPETMNAASAVEASAVLTSTPTVIFPENVETLYRGDLNLAASTQQTIPVAVDGGSEVYFTAYSLEPLSFTLQTPAGTIIDAASSDPTITYVQQQGTGYGDDGWLYQVQVQNPAAGNWQATLQSNSATLGMLWVDAVSDVHLQVATAQYSYHPNDTVVVEAGLLDGTTLITGTLITGTVNTDLVIPGVGSQLTAHRLVWSFTTMDSMATTVPTTVFTSHNLLRPASTVVPSCQSMPARMQSNGKRRATL